VIEMNGVRSLKTMLRCSDFAAARRFYVDVLGLDVVEEWASRGDLGCIVSFGEGGGLLELLATDPDHPKHRPAFEEGVANDKMELQIHVDSVDSWVERLADVTQVEGPVTRPWGNRYLWVRDPDGVRVALFQEPSE
jgi:catechol 2,3-dioxygenase-like lactoylglutathione lyase family enzyme